VPLNYFAVEDLAFHTFTNMTFSLSTAECLGLSGPSGVGKSLFLRTLADLDPHQGKINLEGVDATSMPAPLWRRQVALLPAEPVWWYRTIGEHFTRIDSEWFSQLGFDLSVLDWNISRLSSGEKQRLALLRMLSYDPKVLLLDEPTANLDSKNARQIEELIAWQRQKRQVAVIWVSHNMDQLERVSTRRFQLNAKGLNEIISF
jgi:ABC-type iron transport system FetAB ATPase subunit